MTARAECRVELFGTARLAAGQRYVTLELQPDTMLDRLVALLVAACPRLAGDVVDAERGMLQSGYVLNRNGREFLIGPEATVQPGDNLLLLSNAAGG